MYIDLHALFEVGSLSSHAKSSFHGNQPSRDGDIVQHGDSGCAIPLAPQRAAGTTETTCQVRAKFIQVYHQEVGFVVNLFLCTQTILHIYIYMHGYDVNLAGGVGVPNGATGMRYVTLGM